MYFTRLCFPSYFLLQCVNWIFQFIHFYTILKRHWVLTYLQGGKNIESFISTDPERRMYQHLAIVSELKEKTHINNISADMKCCPHHRSFTKLLQVETSPFAAHKAILLVVSGYSPLSLHLIPYGCQWSPDPLLWFEAGLQEGKRGGENYMNQYNCASITMDSNKVFFLVGLDTFLSPEIGNSSALLSYLD